MSASFQEAQQKEQIESLKAQEALEGNWQDKLEEYEKMYGDHENFEQLLEQKYMDVLKEMNLDLTEAWQSATDLEEELVHGDNREDYVFSKDNPYRDVAFPKKLAMDLINQAKNN